MGGKLDPHAQDAIFIPKASALTPLRNSSTSDHSKLLATWLQRLVLLSLAAYVVGWLSSGALSAALYG